MFCWFLQMTHMSDIVNKCLKSDHPKTKLHGVRAIVHLLRHSRHVATQELLRWVSLFVFLMRYASLYLVRNFFR